MLRTSETLPSNLWINNRYLKNSITMKLDTIDLEAYARDGFLVLPDAVSPAACDALVARARALVDAFDPATISVFSTRDQAKTSDEYFLESGSEVRFFFEEEALIEGKLAHDKATSINKIGHALHRLDPVFAPFSNDRRFADLAAALGQQRPALIQSMVIFKNPFIGGDVACHQDATFLHTEPTSVVGLWIALEDATVDNGCMWALPGGHRGPLRRRFVRKDDGVAMLDLDAEPLPPATAHAPWVPLEARKGTLVVLHGRLPHFSAANRSPRSRHAYAIHFVDDACRYSEDNWLRRV
jgi:phytanoyl-CoA hydroxylase